MSSISCNKLTVTTPQHSLGRHRSIETQLQSSKMFRVTGCSSCMQQSSKFDRLRPVLWPILKRNSLRLVEPHLLAFPQCSSNLTSIAKSAHKGKPSPLQKPDIVTHEPMTELKKNLADTKAQLDAFKDMFVPPSASISDLPSLKRIPGSNILVGPNPGDYRIKHSLFVQASTRVADCPKDGLPEFAFVGRSNVGKSSLINALVQKKEFAETSKKPGKTQVITHYIVNKSWYLVDLPGYGFANVPTDVRSSWNKFTKGYFLRSECLVCVLLLIDASVPPQSVDLDCADWLGQNKVPITIVFTKCDKTKKKIDGRKLEDNVREFLRLVKKSYSQMPPWIMTSSVTNDGKDGLLQHLLTLRSYWSE